MSLSFPLETLKNCTLNEKFYVQMAIIRTFFPQIRVLFSNIRKRAGETSPNLPSSYAPELAAEGFSCEQSAQATFTDHHKQNYSLLAPTSNHKVKQISCLQPQIPLTLTPHFKDTSFLSSSQKILSRTFPPLGHDLFILFKQFFNVDIYNSQKLI